MDLLRKVWDKDEYEVEGESREGGVYLNPRTERGEGRVRGRDLLKGVRLRICGDSVSHLLLVEVDVVLEEVQAGRETREGGLGGGGCY